MQYHSITPHTPLTEKDPQKVTEVVEGHRYLINNRYTQGFEDINFMRVMTYKEMLEHNLPEDFINAQVPEGERDCENCKYYIVSEGIFSQDVAAVLLKRLEFQIRWLPNGFYETAKRHAEEILTSFSRYETFRQRFGFYHIPFSIENLITVIKEMDENKIKDHGVLINEFFNNRLIWKDKETLLLFLQTLK